MVDHLGVNSQPAIKILEFFRMFTNADQAIGEAARGDSESGGLSKFLTEKAQHVSPTMRELPSIDSEDVKLWVSYWRTVGLFS